jgi:hypothetical protein
VTTSFRKGDRVIHTGRPEWGAGEVQRADAATQDGKPCQRLTIRFDREGLKTVSTAFAKIASAGGEGGVAVAEEDWIEALSPEKLRERITRLPETATDPFLSLEKRLANTLALYRFSTEGGPLIAWAAAQTGLADPLTRFSRQELEQFFDKFRLLRDEHLRKLASDARRKAPEALERELAKAAPEARRMLGRAGAMR